MYLVFYNLMKQEVFKKYPCYTLKYDGCLKKRIWTRCLSSELNEQLFSETAIFTRFGEESCGEGNGTPLQHSCLANPMDRGAW